MQENLIRSIVREWFRTQCDGTYNEDAASWSLYLDLHGGCTVPDAIEGITRALVASQSKIQYYLDGKPCTYAAYLAAAQDGSFHNFGMVWGASYSGSQPDPVLSDQFVSYPVEVPDPSRGIILHTDVEGRPACFHSKFNVEGTVTGRMHASARSDHKNAMHGHAYSDPNLDAWAEQDASNRLNGDYPPEASDPKHESLWGVTKTFGSLDIGTEFYDGTTDDIYKKVTDEYATPIEGEQAGERYDFDPEEEIEIEAERNHDAWAEQDASNRLNGDYPPPEADRD